MFELAQRARWQDVFILLESGYPPLYVQILAVNLAFLIFIVAQKLRSTPASKRIKEKARAKSRYGIESLVIAANAIILYESTWVPYVANSALTLQVRTLLRI